MPDYDDENSYRGDPLVGTVVVPYRKLKRKLKETYENLTRDASEDKRRYEVGNASSGSNSVDDEAVKKARKEALDRLRFQKMDKTPVEAAVEDYMSIEEAERKRRQRLEAIRRMLEKQ